MIKHVYENSCIYGDSSVNSEMTLAEVKSAMYLIEVYGDRIEESPDVCINRTITFIPESLAEREMIALAVARSDALRERRRLAFHSDERVIIPFDDSDCEIYTDED